MQDNLGQQLFGDNAILVTANIADHRDNLYPPELALITDAIEKRALEFSTGRHCAHQALHALGIDNFPILRGEHRQPLWPKNIVGSISHCHDIAGAVVANVSQVKSIGLDIEHRKKLNPAIARHICTGAEKAWLSAQAPEQQNLLLLVVFSIKEAIFKCVYQATHYKLRFQQCEVIPEITKGHAIITIELPGFSLQRNEFIAHIDVTDKHICSGALWNYLPTPT